MASVCVVKLVAACNQGPGAIITKLMHKTFGHQPKGTQNLERHVRRLHARCKPIEPATHDNVDLEFRFLTYGLGSIGAPTDARTIVPNTVNGSRGFYSPNPMMLRRLPGPHLVQGWRDSPVGIGSRRVGVEQPGRKTERAATPVWFGPHRSQSRGRTVDERRRPRRKWDAHLFGLRALVGHCRRCAFLV